MNELEILKFEYSILKDKLLLFATGAGGSFLTLIKGNFNLVTNGVLLFTFSVTTIGILINLSKIAKIQKELEELKAKNG